MVAGIVFFALALKQTLGHFGDELETVPAFSLCVGPAIYLLAHDAMRFRTRDVQWRRSLLLAVVALIRVAHSWPALAALAAVTTVCWALVAWEALRHSQTRAQIRRV